MKGILKLLHLTKLPFKKYLFMYVWCLLCAGIYAACALAYPSIAGLVIDKGVSNNSFTVVLNYAGYLIILGVLMIIFQYLQRLSFTRLSQDITINIQTQLIEKITKMNYNFWKNHNSGDIYAVVEKDVSKLESLLSSAMNDAIISVIVAIGVAIYLLYIDCTIGFIIILLALIFASIQRCAGKLAKIEMSKLRNLLGKLSSFTNNIVNNALSARVMGITNKILSDYKTNITEYRNQYLKQIKIMNIVQSTGMAFNSIGLFIILVLGSIRVLNNELSVGILFSLTIYLQRLYSPIVSLGNLYVSLKSIAPITNKVLDILEDSEEVKSGTFIPDNDLHGEIIFQEINFRYLDSNEDVFKMFNLVIASGEKIGIIGRNGSGKTSFIRLLSRLCVPDNGHILLDGVDINIYDDAFLHKNIGIMSQENYLPGWKLKEVFECNDDDYEKVSHLMASLNFPIESFESGLESVLSDNRISLSGGEMQKIAFIRLMLHEKKIYILDEPSSSLDEESERKMIELMRTLLNGKTCVIVTHRKPILEICDRIIELT